MQGFRFFFYEKVQLRKEDLVCEKVAESGVEGL